MITWEDLNKAEEELIKSGWGKVFTRDKKGNILGLDLLLFDTDFKTGKITPNLKLLDEMKEILK